jgi:hypothetical protein
MLQKLNAFLDDFVNVARLADLSINRAQLELSECPPPHKQLSLPKTKQAVYIFMKGNECLKVGKVGPKSKARFASQHYGLKASSSLARSILDDRVRVAGRVPDCPPEVIQALGEHNVGDWIRANTTRFHVFLPEETGAAALSLLEAFLQCKLRPCFEGKPPVAAEGSEEEE